MTESTGDGPDDVTGPDGATTEFVPGTDTGFVGRRTIGLIEVSDRVDRGRLWSLVGGDGAVDDILDELTTHGLRSMPSFGIVEREGDLVRVVARGRVRVVAGLAGGGAHEIDAREVRTWTEEALSEVDSITLTVGDVAADGPPVRTEPFFVLAGVVPASAIHRRFVPAEAAPSTASAVETTDEVAPIVVDAPVVVDEPVEPIADDGAPIDSPVIDHVEPAGQNAGIDRVEPADHVAAGGQDADIIDDVAEPPADDLPTLDFDDRPDELATLDDDRSDDVDRPDDVPEVATAPAEPDISSWAERPVLGVLAFSNGERIPVDGPVLIGRNPKFSGESDGSPLPRIMKFDGPNQGLSRTHAEVRPDGVDIVLEDLHSTNGTEIRLPGQQPERIPGGEPVVLVPGAQIDFGDELFCTLETADRSA